MRFDSFYVQFSRKAVRADGRTISTRFLACGAPRTGTWYVSSSVGSATQEKGWVD
jgi:hypothetical protein